MIDDADDDDTN